MKAVASREMVKQAMGDEFESMSEPPQVSLPDHSLKKAIRDGLAEIYDPEIPVNIYELGLVYKVDVLPPEEGEQASSDTDVDLYVEMTLTSPGCPVAGKMPGWVQAELMKIDGVGSVEVNLVWDPVWGPHLMSETAKLELNMF